MQIQFLYGAKSGALQAALVAAALDADKVLRRKYPLISLDVSSWTEFLRIFWFACAVCSRDERGREIEEGISVSIIQDGKKYSTHVWYDVDAKGLRYVSLC